MAKPRANSRGCSHNHSALAGEQRTHPQALYRGRRRLRRRVLYLAFEGSRATRPRRRMVCEHQGANRLNRAQEHRACAEGEEMGLSRSEERNVERRSTPPLRRPRSAGIPSRPERIRWNDYMTAYEDMIRATSRSASLSFRPDPVYRSAPAQRAPQKPCAADGTSVRKIAVRGFKRFFYPSPRPWTNEDAHVDSRRFQRDRTGGGQRSSRRRSHSRRAPAAYCPLRAGWAFVPGHSGVDRATGT
jgi:hypothetical protein